MQLFDTQEKMLIISLTITQALLSMTQELEASGGMDHDAGGEEQDLQSLQQHAAKRAREYDSSVKASTGSAFTDYSRKAFYKEFVKVWWHFTSYHRNSLLLCSNLFTAPGFQTSAS